MSKRTGPTNPLLNRLLRQLRKQGKEQKVRIWLELAERLEGPRRLRAEVNLSQLNRYAAAGNTIVVPGKVLAAGRLEYAITVGAFKFSGAAKRKIIAAGGEALAIPQLLERNPSGKGIKLME